jgi:hypothetical protein
MRQYFLFPVLVVATLVLLGSCKPEVKVEGPAKTTREQTIEAPVSVLTIPIKLPLDEIKDMVNFNLEGKFLKEWFKVNNEGDSLYLELERIAEAKMRWNNNKLYTTFPIKVSGKFVKKVMGMRLTNPDPIEAEVILNMETAANLAPDWSLNTKTSLQSIDWIKNPELKIAMLKIDIKKPIEEELLKNQDKLLKELDKVLKKEVKISKEIEKIWREIQKPIVLHKEEPAIYLLTEGRDLAATLGTTPSGDIMINVRMEAIIRTMEGELPNIEFSTLPAMSQKALNKDSIQLFIEARLPLPRANTLLNDAFSKQKLSFAGYEISIRDSEIYATDDGIALRLDVSGALKGTIYMVGKIDYDQDQNHFFVKDFKYDIATNNYLLESVNRLVYENLIEYVSSKLRFDASTLVGQIPELIENALSGSKISDKLELKIENFSMKPEQLVADRNAFQVIISSQSKASLQLKSLSQSIPTASAN